jgi:predicted transposase YbfD/YdcC
MGCQKEIANQIVEKEADYIFALKRNQENLYHAVYQLFQEAQENQFEGLPWDYHESEDRSHGRHEIRRCWTIADRRHWKPGKEWTKLRTIGMVESEITCKSETSREYRFYISSLGGDAEEFAKAVRSHWSIENSLHWVLDVSFREDESRVRTGNAAENLSIIRRLALNLIKQEQSVKIGVKAKRRLAGWDENYLLKLLST